MLNKNFSDQISAELNRIDEAGVAKRREKIISGFTPGKNKQGIIAGKPYHIFNSNDYLGLRHNKSLLKAEHEAASEFGVGPGAVRFISGSLEIYPRLEKAVAEFHHREAAMVFSSAFAANLSVISALSHGPGKDSLITADILILSDELNHRSIVDGVRISPVTPEQKIVYKHLDFSDLDRLLSENYGKFARALVVTDGVFSMLGETLDIAALQKVIDKHRDHYPGGILLFVDDCHGVGALGSTGRGSEEISGGQADLLVGTFGKAFGCDGGYVVGSELLISYLRESAATYIYSNPVSPGTAGAALKAVSLVGSSEGKKLLSRLSANISRFQKLAAEKNILFAAESMHPIQPVLTGDSVKNKKLADLLFSSGFLTTPISYPVVPKGRDEIRVQISASHTPQSIDDLVAALDLCIMKL